MTHSSAYTLSVYYCCVATIAEDLAALPWRVLRKVDPAGRELAPDHPVDWLINWQPNPESDAFRFRQVMIAWALTHGNAVAEIERDVLNRPVALWPVEPWRVDFRRDEAGRFCYHVTNYERPPTVLYPEDVIHVAALGDGLVGYSVLDFAARSLGIALTTDRYAATASAGATRPGGALELPAGRKLSPEARDRLRRDWNRIHANPNEIAILEEGTKFSPFEQVTAQSLQLIESRKFNELDVLKWFKMPPPKVGILDKASFQNVEQMAIQYVTTTLIPWGRRLELQTDLKAFGPKQRGTYYTKVNYAGLLRGDSAARAAFYDTMIRNGLLSPDEARALEDDNPIPGGYGRTFFVPANWNTMERAYKGEPVSTAGQTGGPPAGKVPAPAPKADDKPREKTPPTAELAAQLGPVFREAAQRIVRRESHRAADALARNAGNAVALARWRDSFLPEHRGYVADQLRPMAEALAGGPLPAAAQLALADAAERWCADLMAAVGKLSAAPDRETLAAEWVTERSEVLALSAAASLAAACHPEVSP